MATNKPFSDETNIDIIKKYDLFKLWQKEKSPYMKGVPVAFITSTRMNLSVVNSNKDSYFSLMSINMPEVYGSLSSHPTTTDAPTISTSDGILGTILNTVIKAKNSITGDNNGSGGMGSYLNPYSGSPFIRLLSNSFLGLEGKDLSAKTTDIGETFYGYKQTLSGPTIDSIVGDIVTVRYAEEKNLPIIKLHKLWMDYRENVGRGFFIPYEDVRANNEIDFVSSLYYFVLDRDFETILYYSKYTGIVPISNPYSALSASYGSTTEVPDISIDYVYSYKEDLDPRILIDFNMLAQNTSYEKLSGTTNLSSLTNIPNSSDYSSYDPTNKKFYDNPLIVKEKTSGGDSLTPNYRFKLIYK